MWGTLDVARVANVAIKADDSTRADNILETGGSTRPSDSESDLRGRLCHAHITSASNCDVIWKLFSVTHASSVSHVEFGFFGNVQFYWIRSLFSVRCDQPS